MAHTPEIFPIPTETARAARAIFGINNCYIILGNRLANILSGYSPDVYLGPGWETKLSIPILPFLTLFQYYEWQNDQQVMDALQSRVDWKYALHLPMNNPRLPEGALCQYRQKNLFAQTDPPHLQELLERLAADDRLSHWIDQPIDARKMILSVCKLNRLAHILDAMHVALEGLASQDPDWLRQATLPHWYARYYPGAPALMPLFSRDETEIFAKKIGKDAQHLLNQIDLANNPKLTSLEEIIKLRAAWTGQFGLSADRTIHFLPQCATCPSISIMDP